jgi:hypothetical protein
MPLKMCKLGAVLDLREYPILDLSGCPILDLSGCPILDLLGLLTPYPRLSKKYIENFL